MFTKAFAALGLAVSFALAPAASSTAAPTASDPPTGKLVIDLVTANGTGCPPGTVAVNVNPDNTAITLVYSDYMVRVGVGARPTDFRKNCQVNLLLHHPAGFTYAVVRSRPRGYASLQAGAYGVMRSNYYFSGSPTTSMVNHPIDGRMDGRWAFDDQLDLASLDWAPCGELRNLNINTELRVYAGTSDPKTTTSYITMDTLDIAGGSDYHLVWRRCPAS